MLKSLLRTLSRFNQFGRRPEVLLLLAALLPMVLFCVVAWFDRELELTRARDHVEATAGALAEHAQKVVDTADLLLARIADHVQGLDWDTIGDSREIHDFLATLARDLPQIESAFLVDPEGINVASSRTFPMPRINVSTRAYFERARAGGAGVFFSEPFRGYLAGTYAFTITRALFKDGRFDGVVGITISSPYFEAFYSSVAGQPDSSTAMLVRDDGMVLIRFPEMPRLPMQLPPSSPLMQAAASSRRFGSYSGRFSATGYESIATFRHLKDTPLLVNYAVKRVVYLREWYMHLGFFAIVTVLSSAAILYAGRTILRNAEREHVATQQLIAETVRRQKAEAALQQSQKMEALGRLTGGVAHDFNNLLAAIIGSLDLLGRHVREDPQARFLATARKAAVRAAQIISQMLAFSRQQEISVRAVDVNAIVRTMDDLLPGAIGPMIRLHYALDDELWPAIADPAQLEVALLNLAVNARDAMPQGGDLTITTSQVIITECAGGDDLVPGDYVRIAVRDSGEGMSEEVRRRAMEPFFTTKGPNKGTGLGLSMVFGFASHVGGTVRIESVPEHGTTVSIFLRRASGVAEQIAASPNAPPEPIAATPLRILLVDDDEMVRDTTRAILEAFGHAVVDVDGGRAAMHVLAADRRFDVLMVDYAMPEMNGSELAHAVRKVWPEAPLMFVTGYVENDALDDWRERGVPMLRKPFGQHDLVAALARVTGAGTPMENVVRFRA